MNEKDRGPWQEQTAHTVSEVNIETVHVNSEDRHSRRNPQKNCEQKRGGISPPLPLDNIFYKEMEIRIFKRNQQGKGIDFLMLSF